MGVACVAGQQPISKQSRERPAVGFIRKSKIGAGNPSDSNTSEVSNSLQLPLEELASLPSSF
jgi:hypothetical protein